MFDSINLCLLNLVSGNKCELPHDKHVYIPTYYFKGDLKLGAKRSYSCLPGYRRLADRAVCTQDGWKPDPLCSGKVGISIKLQLKHHII